MACQPCMEPLALQAAFDVGLSDLQVVDDVLDFTGSALALGKPALNDLRSGLATAPVLFAAQVCEHSHLFFNNSLIT